MIAVRRRTSSLAVAVYVVAMTAYVYGFEHRADADQARQVGIDEALVIASTALLHVALGVVVGRWPVLLLPLVPVVIAIPAGDYPGAWPEGSVALNMYMQEMLYGMPLVALGVVARRLVERRRRSPTHGAAPGPA